jgi:carbon monoxide dehydrogenase subunit G
MIFEGTIEVKAAREKVWEFVIDPNRIGKCLPDLKSLQIEGEDKFAAVARVGIGFMKGDFRFQLAIVEKNPPSHARLKGTGAGVGSSFDLDTSIDLAETETGTKLTYVADLKIGGTLAGIGQRVIGSTTQQTMSNVFMCVKEQLET